MTTYVEIHALQSVPPSNINRDDTGTPKTALYGGVTRARVSSQSWKRAIREDFNSTLDPNQVGMRSLRLVSAIAAKIKEARPDLDERAQDLAVSAMEAAGFKKPVAKSRAKTDQGIPETGYLVFMSQRQINALATGAVDASDDANPLSAMKTAKVKDLVDAEHSIDIALFGRMVADSTDLNVDAACQVAHALSVHEATPEYDFYTAVDDAKYRNEGEEDAGAGMMGTIGFVSSTLYRYAAINVDQLRLNLGEDHAVRLAIESFLQSFVRAMPTGKQNTFGNATRPAVVLTTVATGQPTSLVGAFEEPIRSSNGYVEPAVERLAAHAADVFETWRRPTLSLVSGLKADREPLAAVGDARPFDDLVTEIAAAALELQ